MVMYIIIVHLIPSGGIVSMQHIRNGRYVVKGMYCSWIRLLIYKRCELETCRYFEFVTLIGLRGGVGDA